MATRPAGRSVPDAEPASNSEARSTSFGSFGATQGCVGGSTGFGPGIDDLVIVPTVASAFLAAKLLRTVFVLLVTILDYAFPVVLQIARFPLFTARMLGDATAAMLTGAILLLPMPKDRRDLWRERIRRHWSWLRQKISYRAFEDALHHVFESGMGWVFRRCGALSPRGALLVIVGALLWLPVSFGLATAMHVLLLAEATSLPAWMQLLHPLATLIAKSKLLVLPAYPAAWPQAKQHPAVQSLFRLYRYLATLHVMRKTAFRYPQAAHALAATGRSLVGAAEGVALGSALKALADRSNRVAAPAIAALRIALSRAAGASSRLPLIGAIAQSYAVRYSRVDRHAPVRLSDRVRGFFARWSIKFTPEYYQARH